MTYPNPAAPHAAASNSADVSTAKWGHLLNILGLLGPLIFYIATRNNGPVTNREGKEALNFAITMMIISIILGAFGFAIDLFLGLGLTILLNWAVYLASIVFSIIGFVQVQKTGAYRYPFAIRLLK